MSHHVEPSDESERPDPPDRPEPAGTIGPTPVGVLLGSFVVGAVLGYALAVLSEEFSSTSSAPRVQWGGIVALFAVAVADAMLAWWTYQNLHRRRRRIDPQLGFSFLLLAKASAVMGAFLAGGYGGFGAHFLGSMDADLPRERVIRSAVAVGAGVTVVISALLLERACRIPRADDE